MPLDYEQLRSPGVSGMVLPYEKAHCKEYKNRNSIFSNIPYKSLTYHKYISIAMQLYSWIAGSVRLIIEQGFPVDTEV